MSNLETAKDSIQHYGIKGMKWGRRKSGEPGIIKKHWDSISRERQWRKVVKNVDSMSTKDINTVTTRIQLENSLKRLSKSRGVGSKKDKQDYLNRGKMSNQELSRKVNRLRAKDSLNRAVKDASKSQRKLGIKLVTTASSLALKHALGQPITPKDVLESARANPNHVKDLASKYFLENSPRKNKS